MHFALRWRIGFLYFSFFQKGGSLCENSTDWPNDEFSHAPMKSFTALYLLWAGAQYFPSFNRSIDWQE